MAEMKDPQKDFKFALAVLEIGSTLFYIAMAVALYCLAGDLTTSPVLSAASSIPAKVAYGIVLPAVADPLHDRAFEAAVAAAYAGPLSTA